MERSGVALPTSCVGDVSMIPKGEETNGVEGLRPITVLSILHRLYAASRLQSDLLDWQERVVKDLPLRACRPKNGTDDLLIPLALTLEDADDELFGASYDLSKAFDSLAFEIEENDDGEWSTVGWGWKVIEKLGFPSEVAEVMKDMYCQIRRQFKINGHLGETVTAEGKRGVSKGVLFPCSFATQLRSHGSLRKKKGWT